MITEVSIEHPKIAGSDCYILHYNCDECGKISKEFHTGFNENYHKIADCCIGDHLEMHSYSDLGIKFETIIKLVKEIK